MAANDDLHDLAVRNQLAVEAARHDTLRAVQRALDELEEDLQLQLLQAQTLTDARRTSINNLKRAGQASIHERLLEARELSGADLAGFAEAATLAFADEITTVLPRWTPNSISASELESIAAGNAINGTGVNEWWQQQDRTTQQRYRRTIDQGVLQGRTNAEMASAIHGTRAANFSDGIMKSTRAQVEGLVRTSALNISNKARVATYKKNSDIIKAVVHACFTAGTMVEQAAGCIPIEKIKPGDEVIGGTGRPRRVKATQKVRRQKMARVKLSNGKVLVCTADHMFLTMRGWVQAKDLKLNEPFASSQDQ